MYLRAFFFTLVFQFLVRGAALLQSSTEAMSGASPSLVTEGVPDELTDLSFLSLSLDLEDCVPLDDEVDSVGSIATTVFNVNRLAKRYRVDQYDSSNLEIITPWPEA